MTVAAILSLWDGGASQQDLWDALFLQAEEFDAPFGFKPRWFFADGSKALGLSAVDGVSVTLYDAAGDPVERLAFRSSIACSDRVYESGRYQRREPRKLYKPDPDDLPPPKPPEEGVACVLYSQGVVTSYDAMMYASDRSTLEERIKDMIYQYNFRRMAYYLGFWTLDEACRHFTQGEPPALDKAQTLRVLDGLIAELKEKLVVQPDLFNGYTP